MTDPRPDLRTDARLAVPAPLHPLRALLLAGSVPLFLGVLLSDVAYDGSSQVQWKNFASWLNAGALVLAGLALLWSVVALVGVERRHRPFLLSAGMLFLGWVIGFANALQHAKDAHATLPAGLVLSAMALGLVAAAAWFALDHRRPAHAAERTAFGSHPLDRAEARA